MTNLLAVENIAKGFGGLQVLTDVSFAVEEGSITGILGPNGAGKTTLFNIISGFLPADAGDVTFEGTRIVGAKPHSLTNRGLARTFQIPRPLLGMSALDNVVVACLAPRARARARTAPETVAHGLLAQVGLGAKMHQQVEVLSYGDLRRLEIARALASHPRLLLLDEPLAGLGPSETSPILDLLNELNRSSGIAIVLIEHKLREFMKFVRRVVALDRGRIIFDGPPDAAVTDQSVIDAYLGSTGGKS